MMAAVINRRVRNETPGVALFLNRTTTNCYDMGQGDGQDEGVINSIGDLLLDGAMAKRDLLLRAGALKW